MDIKDLNSSKARVRVKDMYAFEVLDSRANFTVEARINNIPGVAPAGASTGSKEAKVIKARDVVNKINTMSKEYVGEELTQEMFDRELKFMKDKIGGNGAIALSLSFFNNYSYSLLDERSDRGEILFPYPVGNVIGGGVHNGNMSIQELLVIPYKARTFPTAMAQLTSIYHEVKEVLKKKKKFLGYNDESALISTLEDESSISLVEEVSRRYGAKLGVDVAANSLYKQGKYYYKDGKVIKKEDQIEYIVELSKRYNLYYIEDPLVESDFLGFAEVKRKLKNRLIVGDDITVTNVSRLKEAIKHDSISGIIIKPNQVGTLTDTIETKEMAEKHHIVPVISHRSGETYDTSISRISLLFGFPYIKAGVGGIRTVKYDELLYWWNRAEKKKMYRL